MSDNRALARTAASQFGLLNLEQQRAAGVTKSAVWYRRREGRYDRLARGVDAIAGTPTTWEQRVLAAVLAAGDGVVASHRTALRLWGIGTFADVPIELVSRYEHSHEVPGVIVHRSLDLAEAHTCLINGIPATTVPRTLIDAGAVLSVYVLERQVERACGRGMTTPAELRQFLNRVARRGRRGAGRLRTVLDTRALGEDLTDSELEEVFANLCRNNDLPIPECQVWVSLEGSERRLDFAYVDRKIVIEVDGYDTHSRRDVFEDDRIRQNALVAAGWTILRFTRTQLLRRPSEVARRIQSVL
jgi:very-short-patch-repair endonuclease